MSGKATIGAATLAAMAVAGVSLFLMGWTPDGLAAAVRNTARFSGVVFAVALVARSARWPALFAQRWHLFFAFVAAHGVHYAAVVMLAIFDTGHQLHRMEPSAVVTLSGGFALLLLAAVTAGKPEAPFQSRVHTAFFYLLGVLFLVAFGGRALAMPASAVILAVVVLAFIARVLPPRNAAAVSTRA